MFNRALLSRLSPSQKRPLYMLGSMIFFWAVFDASLSYMVPVVITASGYTKTMMGIILATSSVFGAAFDWVLSRFVQNTNFRRVYFLMFAFCFLCPALLIQGAPIWIFLAVMALWGFYYDLSNFGHLDFVSRTQSADDHASSFGLIWVFRALGYTIAPLIIGAVVGEVIDFKPYLLMWLSIITAFIIFLALLRYSMRYHHEYMSAPSKKRVLSELVLWKKIGRTLFPVLLLTMFLWVIDAFFWTIGPLMSDTLQLPSGLGGLFLVLYSLPPFAFGFFVGQVTAKLHKKRTAQISSLIACILFCSFFFIHNPYVVLIGVFFASSCLAFSIPSLNSAYSDYIAEAPHVEKEIQALQDFFTNIGYVIGPILAGLLADKVGNILSFSYLGIAGIFITLLSLLLTPGSIRITTVVSPQPRSE